MSFGQWYETQKQQDPTSSTADNKRSGVSLNLGILSGGNGNDDEDGSDSQTLPLFANGVNMNIPEGMSWSNLKASMESQMPKKVMGMNYQQRFQVFCTLLLLSILFFGLGFAVGIPMISIRPQKFALCFTFGSLTFMASFAILRGPYEHFMGMVTMDRLPFTVVYMGSMMTTLYCTFRLHGATGYLFVMGSSFLQILALVWYLIAFLPGGSAGMHMLMKAMMTMLKPVIVGCAKLWKACITRLFGRMMS